MIADPARLAHAARSGHVLTAEQQCVLARRCRELVELLAAHPAVRQALAARAREHRADRVATAARDVPALRATLADLERLWWELAVSELRVARREAKRHARGRLPEEDLYQEGCHGLLRAARRFDPTRGVKFAHHAGWWVRAAIRRVLGEDRPVTVSGNSSHVARQVLDLEGLGYTRQAATTALRVSLKLVDAALAADRVLSLELRIDGDEEWRLGDTLVAAAVDVDDDLDDHTERVRLRRALAALPERHRQVVELRADGKMLREIGEQLGCSRERVRQLLVEAEARIAAEVGR